MKNIFVGNLSYDAMEDDLKQAFEEYGEVSTVNVILDRATGRPRGFGFVEMPNDEEAGKAIEELNGKEIRGRAINVNEARPKAPRQSFGGGGGGGRREPRW